ncbi:sigma-54 dependent transcriptional regulator [Fusibacter bizertensis]|uniref:Stage 0 sporulation protein A homolog n=1 Tax=Fusibacter bizertensis TaxID=1488331 RepID=A0ABT6NAU7_9FIRM|nr:sigma-54 dependent transcriptional regulator [Fusibacter bizertensis]MDH8677516.1 sigma-54 dependent transcriptional regulator [Fusibacter bizertensis]
MKKATILIAEDEVNLALLLERILKKEGYLVYTASDGVSAKSILEAKQIDLVLTDIKMPDMDGIELLKYIKKIDSSIEVIVMTAFATVDTAINALKLGAKDYIRKPFDIDEVISAVKKVQFEEAPDELGTYDFNSMLVTNSQKMQDLVKLIHKVANSNANIYIHGETGVGKELVAHAIHEISDRRGKPFIKVNCSALPETLLESELFGYEKGAFTGAFNRKLGRFELANGGTIFLDEIGDISPLIQLKLLRIIQQKELERLGGTQTISLDVRIITATNKSLDTLVHAGQFREDLYYRLNVIPLSVPPLRERREDMTSLIQNFIKISSDMYHTPYKEIEAEAMEVLLGYHWPGNVRELENIIERLLLISEGTVIKSSDLPPYFLHPEDEPSDGLGIYKDSAEEKIIRKALADTDGNITKAAEKLGISRRSLHRKINKYNLGS